MREVLTLHLGGEGAAVGATIWELFCLEHGISDSEDTLVTDDNFTRMFAPTDVAKRYTPRAIFVDSEPGGIDAVREGPIAELFRPSQLIDGKEDSGGVYARGRFTVCPQLVDQVLEEIRRMTEECTGLDGFFVLHSVSGGTGAPLSDLILQRISEEYPKRPKDTVNLFPGPFQDTSVLEPYNTILSTHSLLEHADASIVHDNAALSRFSASLSPFDRTDYSVLNEVAAQAFSSLTASFRYAGGLNVDIGEISTNLVPYPSVHFLLQNLSQFFPRSRAYHDWIYTCTVSISSQMFEPQFCLASCKQQTGKYLACSLHYRGHVLSKDIGAAIGTIKTKRTIQFVDWCPTGFKCGVSRHTGAVLGSGLMEAPMRSASLLSNSTAVQSVFAGCVDRFDLLFAKRAFVHWFVNEGMEEGDFSEASESVRALLKDYEEIAIDTPVEDTEDP